MITLQLSEKTEQRLKQVINLYKNEDKFFNKFIDFQINEIKLGLHNIKNDLAKFEKKYKMKTETFYNNFENGKIGDEDDYMLWAGIYEMYLRDEKKLKQIQW